MTITRSQYLQLLGLQTLAAHHIRTMDGLAAAAIAITREGVDMGHTYDLVWGNRNLDEALGLMGITVEPATSL